MLMDEVPTRIQPPPSIELRVSNVDKKRIGCFGLVHINKGTEFGPYEGRIVYDKEDEGVDPRFSWEVFDLKTFKYVHTVDATSPEVGNWMRYVCCARYFEEQNIVSTQNGTEVYYRALKDIEAGEELLTWFQPKKKKRKRSSLRNSIDSSEIPYLIEDNSVLEGEVSDSTSGHSKQKRRRKPKVIPDAYIGPLDWEDHETPPAKKVREDDFEPLQPGQKRRRRKKPSSDNVNSESSSPSGGRQLLEEDEGEVKPNIIKIEEKEFGKKGTCEEIKMNKQLESSGNTGRKNSSSSESKKESGQTLSIAEINNSVDWEFPKPGEEYNFELKKHHIVTERGKKLYKCDICLGLYKHMFSLKRHYLRNHVNYKYLSKSDMTNCLINLAQVKHLMRKKFPDEITCTVEESQKMKTDIMNENSDSTEVSKKETVENENTVTENIDNVKVCDETSHNCVQETALCGEQCKDSNKDPKSNGEKDEGKSKRNVADTVTEGLNESSLNNNSNKNSDKSLNEAQLETVDTYAQESDAGDRKEVVKLIEDETTNENGAELEKITATETREETRANILMPGLFRCYTCYLTFDDFEGIQEHTQNHPEQTDGACFPCDLCSMRFNYKHNLVRHKKTHEVEEHGKKVSAEVNGTHEKNERPSPKKQLLPLKDQAPQEKKPLLLPSVFRCGICPQKFDTQPKVVKHVEEEHKIGSKFQCMYCGKDFLSMPNMKKHVRFHLGYRATCRICSEAFSNVGALRKHTRVSHPDIYKAKLIERLEKYGVLKGPDKNALSKDIIEKVNLGRKNLKETTATADPAENIKKEVKAETCTKTIEQEEIDHEINFTADEIDDGGSRFKFACTVCKKRFSSYINMCRHRRKVHSNENRNRTEQCLTFGRKPRNNPSPVLENPAEIAAFYANISHNIATNLNCYIDGRPESLKTFVDHIKVEGYTGNFGYNAENDKPLELTWEKYNFPCNYKPVETISFADIKNVLNLHNDFDSHCISVDVRSESKNQDNIQRRVTDVKDITSDGDSCNYLKQTTENTDNCINHRTTEESIEDIEVREINSSCQYKGINSSEKSGNICEVVESDIMGKSSHGLKVLANIGSVLSKKGVSSANSERKIQEEGGLCKFKLLNTDSPAAKTFHQVKLGEYANFQDDLLSCDIDCPVTKGAQLVGNAQSWKNGQCNKQSEESRTFHIHETEKFVKEAQDELEALYDSIDNDEPVTKVVTRSPNTLSELCEKVLGLGPQTKEVKTCSSISVEAASQLKLTTNDSKDQTKKNAMNNGPDYSDAPEESPFYNYETIAFGKNGSVEQVCAICKKYFSDFDALLRHHTKKHPATECSFLEVEQGHEIETLHFSDPSYVGALAVTDPGLDNVSELESFKCTNCDASFKTVTKLHVHIVNCSSIDPTYGAQKANDSLTKTPLKRKLQKKIFNMFGSKNDVKTDLGFTHFKLSQQRNETESQKRVFTGCRKRTSVILPDSPQKLVCEQKITVPTASGYNPQNHVRRRELTEILDTLTCEACGLKFKTIIILERHIKYCTKKEKFKSIQPMACPLIDESLEKIKNMCFYCNKNFTYTKSLLNHYQDFCPIKRARLDKGELTEQDRVKEKEIIQRIQKADEEKALKQKEMENRPKRNMTWQVGRKSKRKGHSWTNIKKRSQPKQSLSGIGNAEGSEENEDSESSGSESEVEDSTICASKSDTKKGSGDVKENSSNSISDISEGNRNGLIETVSTESSDNSENVSNSCSFQVMKTSETFLSSSKNCESEKNSVMNSCIGTCEEDTTVVVPAIQEVISSSNIVTALSSLQDFIPSCEKNINAGDSDQTSTVIDEHVKVDTDVNNTSLNCTARYNVNQLKAVTKYRPIVPKPRASSVIFQCVSKQIPVSKYASSGNQLEFEEDNKSPTKVSNEIEDSSACIFNSEVKSSVPIQAKGEASFQLAQQGLVTGKRKRARVGKVEEFLRNAFKRKRKKNVTDLEKASESSAQVCSSFIILNQANSVYPGTNNTIQSEGKRDISLQKSKMEDENTLNTISNVEQTENSQTENRNTCDTDRLTRPSHGMCETINVSLVSRQNSRYEQNEIQLKKGLQTCDTESYGISEPSFVTKRGRGRPRGSLSKKPDQNITKNVQGRKRGRPRKVQAKESSTNGEVLEANLLLVDNSIDLIMDKKENAATQVHKMQFKANNVEERDAKIPMNVSEGLSGSDGVLDMGNNELKGDRFVNLKYSEDTNTMNTNSNESCMDIKSTSLKETLNSPGNPDFDDKSEHSYQFHMYQGHGKHQADSETVNFISNTTKARKESTINDLNNLGIPFDSVETISPMNTQVGEPSEKNVAQTNQITGVTVEPKYSDKQNIQIMNEKPALYKDSGVIINGSFDEVDGVSSTNNTDEIESRKTSIVTNNHISDSFEFSNDYSEKHTKMISSLAQATGWCTGNNKIKDKVLQSKDDEIGSTEENCTEMSSAINEVGKLEGKGLKDGDSCIGTKTEEGTITLHERFDESGSYRHDVDKDKCASFHDKNDLQKEVYETLSDMENTGNMSDDVKTDEIEPKSDRDQSNLFESNECNILIEPVLSPSERVKMNKRSCKKDVDLTSPVWVKRTKLNKTKIEKKLEMCNDSLPRTNAEDVTQVCQEKDQGTSLKIAGKSFSAHSGFRCKKRKVFERDGTLSQTFKHSKLETFKGSVKKTTKDEQA